MVSCDSIPAPRVWMPLVGVLIILIGVCFALAIDYEVKKIQSVENSPSKEDILRTPELACRVAATSGLLVVGFIVLVWAGCNDVKIHD
jgi:uncharacterized BrkB/YihY/UPF0761 family membrane protein